MARRKVYFRRSFVTMALLCAYFIHSPSSNAQEGKKQARNFVDASSNNFPPMNVLDESGNLTGFGRELSDAVIEAINGKVTHIHSSRWVEVLELLDTGKADFIHDTGYTEDRDKFLDYSDPIIEMPEVIFVRKEQYDISNLDSLKGKNVACVEKHITHLYLQKFPTINCHIVNTPVQGLYELVSGTVDAFVYPKQIVLYQAQKLRLLDKIKIMGEPLRILTWSMVVKEGNKDVLELLNRGIAKVRKSGEYSRIYNKWWGRKVFSGYSKRELQIFGVTASGISILVVLSISLLFFNHKLRKSKSLLESEVVRRRQSEKSLKASEERFDLAMRFSNDGLYDWNLETNEIYYSPGWKKMLGYEDHEIRNNFSEWERLTKSEDVKESWEMLNEILDGKRERFVKEFQMRHKDGHWVDILSRANVIFNDEGKGVRVVGTHVDISERKQSEEALRKQNYYLEKSQELGKLGTWELDLINNILVWTDENCRIFQVPEGSVVNYEIFLDKVHPEDREYVDREWKAGVEGKPYDIEHRLLLDGEVKWVREKADLEFDDDGKAVNAIGFSQDITERKEADIQRQELEEKLRQAHKMEAIGALAGGIAHDFNNVLGIIIGNLELAIDDVPEWNPARHSLTEARTACLRAKDMVKQILAFSRESKQELKTIDMVPIIEDAIQLLRSSVPSTIDIQHDIAVEQAVITADTTQIHQVLMNLCTNAVDSMKEMGSVLQLRLSEVVLDKDTVVELPGVSPGKFLRLTVSDTGHGMDENTIRKIFDPYFTTKEVGKGTGMGLAVVHGIVEKHGGAITVYSEPKRGTTFHIFFPKADSPTEDRLENSGDQLLRGDERILFVDDETMLATLGERLLKSLGYKVESRTSSIDALELFRACPEKYDLVITDMTMPNMTGEMLAKQVMEIRSEIPVILCTGYSSRVDEEKAYKLGIKGFVMKPLIRSELASTVRRVLDKQ